MGNDTYINDFDPIGNRIQCTIDNGQLTTTNVYSANQLNQYTYDYMNRRISKSVSVMSGRYISNPPLRDDPQGAWSALENRNYIYDGWNLVAEIIIDQTEFTTNANYYTWGVDLSGTLQGAGGVGGLLCETKTASSSTDTYYALSDANGNITEYVDNTGAVKAHYEYNAFGETTPQPDSLADAFSFRFSSKYFDSETGFYYYGRRYFDPVLACWLSRDPIAERGGLNVHGFTRNNPIDFVDILGLNEFSLKWVDRGVVYDGNNLWVGVWLWPESPPKTGYVIAKINIKEAELKKCDGTTVSGNLAPDNLVTLDRFIDSKFFAQYNPSENDDGIFKGRSTSGGGNFRNGIYYALINTKIFSDTSRGHGLVDCQKGKVVIEFSFNVSSGNYGDTGLEWNDPGDDSLPYKDFKSFTNEALHKPVRRPYEDDGYKYSEFSSKTITVDWDWCNEANRKSKKVNKSPNLPSGPNRSGR